MNDYNNNFELNFGNNMEVKSKLKEYFLTCHFTLDQDNPNELVFIKKGSFLDGWKTNPLDWTSKICINLNEDNSLKIHYEVSNNGIISPVAFAKLYNNFILNFSHFVKDEKESITLNNKLIRETRKQLLTYFLFVLTGMSIGFLIGFYFSKITNMKIYGYVGIVVGAIISKKLINEKVSKQSKLNN